MYIEDFLSDRKRAALMAALWFTMLFLVTGYPYILQYVVTSEVFYLVFMGFAVFMDFISAYSLYHFSLSRDWKDILGAVVFAYLSCAFFIHGIPTLLAKFHEATTGSIASAVAS